MESNIGVGIIIGIVVLTTSLIWKSEKFSNSQKVFLSFCILFPPLQWLSAIIIYLFNSNKESNQKNDFLDSQIRNSETNENSAATKKENLDLLFEKGLLSKIEYENKLEILESQNIYTSQEFKSLKILFDNGLFTKQEFDIKLSELLKVKGNKGQNSFSEDNGEKEFREKSDISVKAEKSKPSEPLGWAEIIYIILLLFLTFMLFGTFFNWF